MSSATPRPPETVADMGWRGENHEAVVHQGILCLRVWRRTDLDAQSGAALAQSMADRLVLAVETGKLRGVVLDLSEAPPVAGPITQAAIQRMCMVTAQVGVPLGAVAGPTATHQLQLKRLVQDTGPLNRVCADAAEAQHWARSPHP